MKITRIVPGSFRIFFHRTGGPADRRMDLGSFLFGSLEVRLHGHHHTLAAAAALTQVQSSFDSLVGQYVTNINTVLRILNSEGR